MPGGLLPVVALLDSTGTAVVKYRYDAWGKPISKTGDLASTLGTIQPFRYRGYVYDEETGLYYLRSRYYNISTIRFLNADTILGQRKLLGHNIYDYCKNSPVSYSDPSGHETQWDIYVVYVRQPFTPMYDNDYNLIEMATYDTGPIYTKTNGTRVGGRIAVYYFDNEGNEHNGYMLDEDVIVWYGSSPDKMSRYYERYFGDFFENQNADINFLRRDNSFQKKNAALNVMLKRFLDSRDSQDTTSLFVNNSYSYATEWAVREFQEHVGISVDGIAGKETLDALREYNVSIYRHFVPE